MPHVIEDRGYTTPCHVWTGALHAEGYGTVKDGDRTRRAHVVAYEKRFGPIPAGLEPDHLCRVRACVNAEHMEPVPHAENCRRGAAAKITMDIARSIRERRAAGERAIDIADDLGIAACTVSNITAGRRWAA